MLQTYETKRRRQQKTIIQLQRDALLGTVTFQSTARGLIVYISLTLIITSVFIPSFVRNTLWWKLSTN